MIDTKTKTAAPKAAKTPKAEPIIATGAINIPLPAKPARAGGGKANYPFDALEVNTCFSVLNKTRREMTGPLASANKRYKSELKDAEGKVTVVQTREFYAVDVDADLAKSLVGTPHEGASVLIIRSK